MKYREYYHRHLPHWQPQGAVFFVTFRLKNSLPYDVIESLRAEREHKKVALKQLPERNAQSRITLMNVAISGNGTHIWIRRNLVHAGFRNLTSRKL